MQGRAGNRWVIAVAGTVMQIALGAVYAWSVFRKPLTAELGASITDVNFAFTLTIVMLSFGAFVGGLLLAKVGPRVVGIYAGLLYGAGTFLAGFSDGNLTLLYITYGAIAGTGIGLGYIVPIATLVKWFPERRGIITGVAVAGFGCGALVFGPLARELIVEHGVWVAFQILGSVFFVMIVAAAAVLRDPPPGYRSETIIRRPSDTRSERQLTAALRTWQWYALWLLLFLNVTAGISIIAEAAPMAQELGGASDLQAATLVGTIAIFNGAGRFVWAAVSDRIGRRAVFVLMLVIQGDVFAALPHATSYDLFLALACVGLLCYGGGFGTMPAFVADYFGSKNVGKIYGLMLTAWGAGAVVGPVLLSRIRDATGEYTQGLQVIAAIMLVTSVLPLLVSAPRGRREPIAHVGQQPSPRALAARR